MLLPTMFPMAISEFFLIEAETEVNNSGKDVPRATIVKPIKRSLKPNILAMAVAESTQKLLPRMIKTRPTTVSRIAFGREKSFSGLESSSFSILEEDKSSTLFEIILYQGLNRQIRKMFEFLGYNVINLKRIRHANIELTGLKKGQIKQIKPRQIKELKAYLNKIKEEK